MKWWGVGGGGWGGRLWGVEVQKISGEEKGQCHSGRPTWMTTESQRSGHTSSRASDHEQRRSHRVVGSRL